MRLSEIGLLLLAASAVAGLFLVVTGQRIAMPSTEGTSTEEDPVLLLEADLARLMYGTGFRDVPAAPPDTMVRSMDLVDSISIRRANLEITRALERRGFFHSVTYIVAGKGLSFVCTTPAGSPFRLELNNNRL
ncbi:MAG: hypothetical protein AVO35_12905 [Candidatus Aegiribacteria sp. MLS_C]|nr:MAG: hypothetical protein AVO35_12905 [Candidatus Aegiribacteria sp. MLS_C]